MAKTTLAPVNNPSASLVSPLISKTEKTPSNDSKTNPERNCCTLRPLQNILQRIFPAKDSPYMDINTAGRASSAAYWPTDARAVKENGSLISYMAGAFDNITLNTLARTTNSLAVAGSGLAVIGAIAHIQQLLTEANGPKSLDIATLTTIKSELLTEKDVIASALQTQTKTKQHYIQHIQNNSDPRPDFRKIQKTLIHYTSLIDNTTAAHHTLEDAIDAITKQLSDLKRGHHADIRRHTLEVATDFGSLASAIATTVHHSLNPLGVAVAASTLLLARVLSQYNVSGHAAS